VELLAFCNEIGGSCNVYGNSMANRRA
jgi:hypothetical protein